MKTLQDIKNEIAVENGCENWNELLSTYHIGEHQDFYDQVSIRYANSKLDEVANNMDWSNCYDSGNHCGTDRHEKYILSFKDI